MRWIIALAILSASTCFAGTKEIEGEIRAREYNELLKRWIPRSITLYVDSSGAVYFDVEDTLIPVRGHVPSNKYKDLVALGQKAAEWTVKAREAKLEASKPLGEIVSGYEHKHGLWFTFFSANKSEQIDVIMRVVDFENQFGKAELYLDRSAVAVMNVLLGKVPEVLEQLRAEEKKADILN